MPEHTESVDSIRQRFQNASPYPYVVLDSFILPERCAALLEEFPPFSESNARSDNGEPGRKSVHSDVSKLGPTWKQLGEFVSSPHFLGWMEAVTGIDGLLHDPTYFGAGAHESIEGEDLDFHVDFNFHPYSGHFRRLNILIYLNEDWQPQCGGELLLHGNPTGELDGLVEIPPIYNRCVIMESSDRSWHGFRRVAARHSRRSIALYLYTKEALPGQENSRTTVYRDWPLPTDLGDRETVTRLISRRLGHFNRLQTENEKLLLECQKMRRKMKKEHRALAETVASVAEPEDISWFVNQIDEEIEGLYNVNAVARRLREAIQMRWHWLGYLRKISGKK